MAFYSGNPYERYMMLNRYRGPYAGIYWMLISCNIVILRSCSGYARFGAAFRLLFVISLIVNMGMWLERFVIVVMSFEPRFLAFVLGHVLPDEVGLGHLCGHLRAILYTCFLFVYPASSR